MRSPVIAFSLFAAATVVSGAPAAPPTGGLTPKGLPVVGSLTGGLGARAFDKSDAPIPPSAADVDGVSERHSKQKGKRAYDYQTAGGNSYTGSTSNTSGGTVVNEGGDTDTLTNTGSNTGGTAGDSESGDATGGDGRGHGPGGNAYTGSTGHADGGNIINESGSIANTAAANTAGDAGASDSGDAVGGDAVGDPDTTPVKRASDYASANGHAVNGHAVGYPATAPVKRASDYATAGGNAYTGSTGNTGSGNIVNEAGEGGDDTSTLTNTGPSNDVAAAGDSTTGDAEGGRGDGKGPGGNGYSGHAGPARGGNVINEGGTIGNTAATNIAGAGADSTSGDSEGGSA